MKEKLKKLFPTLYKVWHEARLRKNKKKEKLKKESYDKYGTEVLADLFRMVIANNYDVSCYYGTMLGLVRDDELIPWDDDLDFIILNTKEFSWKKFENDMKSAGFSKYRTIEIDDKIVGQSYVKKKVLCDFSLRNPGNDVEECLYGCYQIEGRHYDNGKEQIYQYWKYQVPQISNLIVKKIKNISIKIPENYEDILIAYYGENWRIPDPNFKPNRKSIEVPTKITVHR